MKQSRGFAIVVAISMVIIVGALLAVVGSLVSHDFKRTHETAASAQLNQLLLAGSAAAVEQSRGWGDIVDQKEIAIEVPVDGAALTITITPVAGEDAVRAIVRATFADRQSSCTLTFQKKSTGWITSQVD